MGRRFMAAAGLVVLLLAGASARAATDYLENTPPLMERLTPDVVTAVFPGADRVALDDNAGPPAAAVYKGDAVIGYIFSTLDVVRAPGYSGAPFDIVAGVDLDGKITGAVVLYQREPHIQNDNRRTELMERFMDAMTGVDTRLNTGGPRPNFIAGATVSARAMRNAIRDSARIVLRARLGGPIVTEPTLDVEGYRPMTVDELLADGSIVSADITNAAVAAAMKQAGAADAGLEIPPRGGPDQVYMQLRIGLATPAMIGRNAIDDKVYERLFSRDPAGSQGILLASSGRYDFQGYKYHNKSSGYRLDRFRIVQGDHTFEFDHNQYLRTRSPLGNVAGVAVLPPDSGFDPLRPWKAEILVHATDADGHPITVSLPAVNYKLPAQHILMPEPPPLPAWVEAWRDERTNEIILGTALATLTLILAFQSVLARYRRVHRWVRNGFLVFTLGWLGWTVGGQLSIVHVINYLQAPFKSLDYGFYLVEPLIVMLSLYTAISLVLLGRGVFCGWLCPFGALQELLAQVARLLRLPQWNPSERLQKKLWLGKYASAAIVIGLAFVVPAAGSLAAEVEPFKTAMTSMFAREWPFVAYAVVLLAIGLFTERAYCRFLCPLGGTLAILDRLHLVNLLKRRPECGSPCRLCERSCPVRAIETTGAIEMAECFQCLDCQVEYYDDQRCPPLVRARKLRQRSSSEPRPDAIPVPVAARDASPA